MCAQHQALPMYSPILAFEAIKEIFSWLLEFLVPIRGHVIPETVQFHLPIPASVKLNQALNCSS